MEKIVTVRDKPYRDHLRSHTDLVTTYEAIRAGFIALALEKNRRATPHIAEARALKEAASCAKTAEALKHVEGIQSGLLTAAGLSEKALTHLRPGDKDRAIDELIENFLAPAGKAFIEELVFRFLLIRGDTLGGSMRNVCGAMAQRKLTRAIVSSLKISGRPYKWLDAESKRWVGENSGDPGVEQRAKGLNWQSRDRNRTLMYNVTVPFVKSNVDLCLFDLSPAEVKNTKHREPNTYIAVGELKGGIDPAGADERWKTTRTALHRITAAFQKLNAAVSVFYIGAAVESRMGQEIWQQLKAGGLSNAANLNDDYQIASISRWLCNL